MAEKIIITKNKKAIFDYHFVDTFTAGIKLTGTEIKAIREKNVNLLDAYCFFHKDELFIKNLHISEYSHGTIFNHKPNSTRKLLLNKRELKKLLTKVKERGHTIIPFTVFLSERGFAKIEIALAKGKKTFDKRASIKEKDMDRELARQKKW